MKIIDLLNKIANGEEVPKKIKYIFHESGSNIFTYNEEEKEYDNSYEYLNVPNHHLNDEVEIIDDEYKVKPLTKQDIEALGYACGEIQKCFTNGWNKSLENKPFKEDKEIEKIDIMSDEATPNSYYILNEHGTKCYLTKHSKVIADRVNLLIDKVNNMENKQ